MVNAYAARFRKAINKAEIGNLLPAQMQVMDFIAGLWSKLAIIINSSNATNPIVVEVKELKVQILKLKAEIKETKYVSRKDRKPSQNNRGNRKSPYREPNRKPVDKRNLKYFNCEKKGYFKSECKTKLRDRID